MRYSCFRGTNKNEGGVHSKLIPHSSAHNSAPDFSMALLSDTVHRHNLDMGVEHIIDHPIIHHYDTWLVDKLQEVTDKLYGERILYHNWMNTSIFASTGESFGILPVNGGKHGMEPYDNTIELSYDTEQEYSDEPVDRTSRTLRFVTKCQNTRFAITPVSTVEEKTLFYDFVMNSHSSESELGQAFFETTCKAWNRYKADGRRIFYKLPAHLQSYKIKKFDRNRNIKKSTKERRPFEDNSLYNASSPSNSDPQQTPVRPLMPKVNNTIQAPAVVMQRSTRNLTINNQRVVDILPALPIQVNIHNTPGRFPMVPIVGNKIVNPTTPPIVPLPAISVAPTQILAPPRIMPLPAIPVAIAQLATDQSKKTPRRCRKCFDEGRIDNMMKCKGKGGINFCDAEILKCGTCGSKDCPQKFNPAQCGGEASSPLSKKPKTNH